MPLAYHYHPGIRVAIVDDQPAYRDNLSGCIEAAPGLQLVGAHATGEAGLRGALRRCPDVIITSLNLARSMDGAHLIRELRKRVPQTQVIVHTSVVESHRIAEALAAGAVGYLLKGEPPDAIIAAIRQVMKGGSPLSAAVARVLVESFHRADAAKRGSSFELLTSREMQVLSATSQGASNKKLALAMGLSTETVRNHLRHIYGKLQVSSRTEAAALYWSELSHPPLATMVA